MMKVISKYPFLALAALLAMAALISWNQSRLEVNRLIQGIEVADTTGTDTTASRASLDTFIQTHSFLQANYELAGSFDRDVATATAATSAAKATQAQAYAAAQAACTSHTSSVAQAKCNQDYLDKHLQPTPVPQPAPVLTSYRTNVRGPWWTTDLTGALLLGAACALAIGFVKMRPRRLHR